MVDLKPCPFCDGPAELVEYAHPTEFYQARCTVCAAKTEGRNLLGRANAKENKLSAATAWNRRSGEATP